jgi:hypothetical protein
MGVVETEFLRRFNATSGKTLTSEHGPVITNLIGQRLLASRPGKQPIRLPREHNDWISQRSAQLIEDIRSSGYDVRGDLNELRPAPPPSDEPEIIPEQLAREEVDSVAFDLVALLIAEVVRLRGQVKTLTAQVRPRGPLAKKAAAKKAAALKAAQAAESSQPSPPETPGEKNATVGTGRGGRRSGAAKAAVAPQASAKRVSRPRRDSRVDDDS